MPKRTPFNDGPRTAAPTPGGADDLFNARARPAPVTAAGVPATDADRERVLAGWLRRAMAVACPGCGKPIEWAGRWEDMPQCPGCHRIPELESLIGFDKEYAEQARTPAVTKCRYCNKSMAFVINEGTGREGPIAVGDAVYAVFLPAVAQGDRVEFRATTGTALRESGGKIVFPDGREIPLADVLFHVSHFSTCPSAAAASRSGGYRR